MESALLHKLQNIQAGHFSATVGFDAVVDQVSHVIRSRHPDGTKEYFRSIAEFAAFLSSKAGLSASLELETVCEKIGGNMAIYANALGNLGVQVHCAGSFGNPSGTIFGQMNSRCECVSICEQAFCQALEFDDGKLMMASLDKLQKITWELLVQKAGVDRLTDWLRSDSVLALLNWSELGNATLLFRMIYRNLLEPYSADKNKYVFVDISDASRRRPEELAELAELLRQFELRRKVILSVNENECRLLAGALGLGDTLETTEQARLLRKTIGCSCLVLHLRDCAKGFTEEREENCSGYFVERPLFSTGGGDNFNAGFSLGLMAEMTLCECLQLGNAVSGFYVRQGRSPGIPEIIRFLTSEEGQRNA